MSEERALLYRERVTEGLLRAIRGREPLARVSQWQRRLDRAWGFCRKVAKRSLWG